MKVSLQNAKTFSVIQRCVFASMEEILFSQRLAVVISHSIWFIYLLKTISFIVLIHGLNDQRNVMLIFLTLQSAFVFVVCSYIHC